VRLALQIDTPHIDGSMHTEIIFSLLQGGGLAWRLAALFGGKR
jgi:hypothetical protein